MSVGAARIVEDRRDAMTHSEHFYLTENGHGRWIIRHQITDIMAGTILRTAGGF